MIIQLWVYYVLSANDAFHNHICMIWWSHKNVLLGHRSAQNRYSKLQLSLSFSVIVPCSNLASFSLPAPSSNSLRDILSLCDCVPPI